MHTIIWGDSISLLSMLARNIICPAACNSGCSWRFIIKLTNTPLLMMKAEYRNPGYTWKRQANLADEERLFRVITFHYCWPLDRIWTSLKLLPPSKHTQWPTWSSSPVLPLFESRCGLYSHLRDSQYQCFFIEFLETLLRCLLKHVPQSLEQSNAVKRAVAAAGKDHLSNLECDAATALISTAVSASLTQSRHTRLAKVSHLSLSFIESYSLRYA